MIKTMSRGVHINQFNRRSRGFTLVELMVTMTIFLIVMAMGFNFFIRTQRMVQLSESEAKMQMYARQAMTILSKELRQASDYKDVKYSSNPLDPPTTHAKKILFVRPKLGNSSEFTLVSYWYEKDAKGQFSLYRAEKPNLPATSDKIAATDLPNLTTGLGGFSPSYNNAAERSQFNIRALIREATALKPGDRSYFAQSTDNIKTIDVRLVTAIYGIKEDGAPGELEVKRQFSLNTSINARNLN